MEWQRRKKHRKRETFFLCPYCEDEDTWIRIREAELHTWVDHRILMDVVDLAKIHRRMFDEPLPLKKVIIE